MKILNILRKYKKNLIGEQEGNLLEIRIDGNKLINNLSIFRKLFPHHHLAVVLKSNAYGHGLVEMGRFLDVRKEVAYFIVDSILEAKILREYWISKPIIIIGYVSKKAVYLLKKIKDCSLVVNSLEQAKFLSENINFSLVVHVKADTGMHRQGIEIEDIDKAIEFLEKNKKIRIEGLMSHLADADGISQEPTLKQIELWKKAVKIFKNKIPSGLLHFSATAGSQYTSHGESNLIRVGIGAYGFDPTSQKKLGVDPHTNPISVGVEPILSFWAKTINIKNIKEGESVGYNFTWKAEKETCLATIPCGYYEGIPRILSNQGVLYYEDEPLKIIGRISMNLTVVDASSVKDKIRIEDKIEIFSDNQNRANSIENVASMCGTIPYEILVKLAPTIRRVIK
ncbi:MAG: alanine racemase [Candidatus Paceibacterota bacterium]|jgi:alanine racemase